MNMYNNEIFETFDGDLEDLFTPENKYTFLVGAGISMDSPTNMPSAMQIVRTLLEFCTPPEEVENLLSLNLLRYELVVEKIQQIFDEDLKFMDYIELVTSANLIHYFLARLIVRGYYVITTNFDYLIERALINTLPENQRFNIYPIITKEDFLSFQEPKRLIETGKYPVFKIHGSKRNIITGELTQDSLITTISALGREREEGVTFAIEPYKKPAVYNIMNDRTLVIMGYSGSDDFDIGPMLKELPFLSRLIWIEHSFDEEIKITKINKTTNLNELGKLPRSKRFLAEIRTGGDFDIFLINAHTINFIKNKLWKQLLSNLEIYDVESAKSKIHIPGFREWIAPLYKDLPILEKYRLACQLYYFLKEIDATIRCSEIGKNLADKMGDEAIKSHFQNFLGMINLIRGNYDQALEQYYDSLRIDEQFDNLAGKTTDLSNIGSAYITLGRYEDALERFEEALRICEQIGDFEGKAADLNNIGRIHEILGEFDLALKNYTEALQITSELGDLGKKATLLNNIGMIYGAKGEFDLALKNYEEALHITDQLGDLYGKIILLNNIGRVHDEHQNYDTAIEMYEKTINIAEQLGDLSKKAGCLNNVGSIYLARGNSELALEKYKEALKIEERLGDPLMIAIYLNNIGMIYASQGKLDAALTNYETALQIAEEIGDNSKVALFLTKIGGIYINKNEFQIALEKYERAERHYKQLGDSPNRAACLSNIGKINENFGHYDIALKIYKKTLEIDDELEDFMSKASDFNNIGKIYEIQEKYKEAMNNYEQALDLFNHLGQQQYAEYIQGIIDKLKKKFNDYSVI
ncbi:MAG: tetratricopeptide repeat protein [Promethearchaeota archaeon]|nr:MAG: tetratricopeptide repeat protein [Candidatus Lokiarchaeota archaeon]